MTHALYLLDPEPGPAWAPFAGIRPLAELRAGAYLVRERWENFIGTETTAIFSLPHLAGFPEAGVPTVETRRAVTGPAIIGSSTFAPRGLAGPLPDAPARLTHDGITVGWAVPAGSTWTGPVANAQAMMVDGLLLHGVHDLVTALEQLLREDTLRLLGDSDPVPKGAIVIGDPAWISLHEAALEPGVVFDTRNGPVVLESGVEVRSGTRLEGPLWVGANTRLVGGPIRHSAIGPWCVVHGELSTTALLGFANKSHYGFVGHSVLGRWVNLGAGTTTSNLKSTYGPVRLQVAGASLETGHQFLGSLFGDHAKTAVGMMFDAGSVIGAGASVFDDVRAPKYIAPFAWGGSSSERMDQQKLLDIVERVYPRRHVEVSDATRAYLRRAYNWLVK
ncbi:MAG TPA: putative sugar nucleotidyl transferase [Gemmatimonadales bacterium]|jgi:UDP-N-acetylglucosamine diphosphorylase/glucosamine-1-phosphate N-acetyltransferase|nr:putative sugar nucleotidyl transferase [Gemmatimonadales bacterium]